MTHPDILDEQQHDAQLERRVRLEHLARKFWIGLEDPPRSVAGEDVREMLDGTTLIDRWASITRSSVDSYFIKTFATRQRAVEWLVENVFDDIFCEWPWAICDLDSNREPWGRLYRVARVVPIFSAEY